MKATVWWCNFMFCVKLDIYVSYSFIMDLLLGVFRHALTCTKCSGISRQYLWKRLTYCFNFLHVVRHPLKLQYHHVIKSYVLSSIPKLLQNSKLPMSPDSVIILIATDYIVLTLQWFNCQSFSVYRFKYLSHPFSEGPCSYHLFFIFSDLFF